MDIDASGSERSGSDLTRRELLKLTRPALACNEILS